MTVSIIIAAKTWQKNLEECVDKCRQLDYPAFEILILPDFQEGTIPAIANTYNSKGTVPIRIIPTGRVSPAQKRDIAIGYATGQILAFIDDDAYPAKDWLKNALEAFRDENVAAVGGPAVTAPQDNLRQKASGIIYASFLVSGKFTYRYLPKKRRDVDDYPSCNFLVRKSIMRELGGFNTNFWPGEDTKLCLDITKRLGKKIVYDPKVLVYHHRRPVFLTHLKQVANYALHRGYFAKKYPETSLKLVYFIPALFLSALIIGAVFSLISLPVRIIYSLCLSLYLVLLFIISAHKDFGLLTAVFFGVMLTHFAYGFYFLKGLISKRLREEL